jgi:class 3 adenylate cyclase/tetratricopeptide (TPR) repeat protein
LGVLDGAHAALGRGDFLIAYDEACSVLDRNPDDLEARYLAALSLARAGATSRARELIDEVLRRAESATDVPPKFHEDSRALIARLSKDDALASTGAQRTALLRHAATLYAAVADSFGGFYSCINAATLYLLAGETDRAREFAERAQQLVDADRARDPDGDYWREATAAEAALVLGDTDSARSALISATAFAGDDFAAMAVTRRQLRLICNARSVSCDVLDALAPPTVLHYCGHRIDQSEDSRFPASMERSVADAVEEFLGKREVRFGYGSLASGADILIAEALLAHGARLQVVLPCAADEFDRVSVAPAGQAWSSRFRACLARSASTVFASDSAFVVDDELFGYAARIAMGHAINRAQYLDAPVEQLAIWDGVEGNGNAGTAHDVTTWRQTGNPTHIISLPPRPLMSNTARGNSKRHVGAILFTDFRGFSRLRDEHLASFVHDVFTPLGQQLEKHARALLWCNTWGDAIAAIFSDVTAAADCALSFHETLRNIDLAALGLPDDLQLRIGAHAGPVLAFTDPVGRRPTYWGRELTRTARIEPRTPEGQVYVTDAFAALLALESDAPFRTEYVGQITTAKDFETVPMYRLERRHTQ